jgi:hypothetical protein
VYRVAFTRHRQNDWLVLPHLYRIFDHAQFWLGANRGDAVNKVASAEQQRRGGQCGYRLRGAERVKVQTRLAVIYLLDAMPEKALKILRDGKTKNLGEALLAQRRYLQSRALAELDQIDEALALLAADDSGPAQLLRAGIYWRGQRWSSAAETTENLLGQRWRADEGLNAIEQSQVVQLAVSYYMAGDAKSLKGVNRRYGDKMAKGPHAETFRVLTHNVDQSQTKFRDLAGQIARVADLEAFMASYRDKLKAGGLSAIN